MLVWAVGLDPRNPLLKGRIPNHRAPNQQLTSSWSLGRGVWGGVFQPDHCCSLMKIRSFTPPAMQLYFAMFFVKLLGTLGCVKITGLTWTYETGTHTNFRCIPPRNVMFNILAAAHRQGYRITSLHVGNGWVGPYNPAYVQLRYAPFLVWDASKLSIFTLK